MKAILQEKYGPKAATITGNILGLKLREKAIPPKKVK
jgi:hypothetical protein